MLGHGKPQVRTARHCYCLNVLTVLTGVENVWGSTADIIPVKVSGGSPTTLNLRSVAKALRQLRREGNFAAQYAHTAHQLWSRQDGYRVETSVETGGDAA